MSLFTVKVFDDSGREVYSVDVPQPHPDWLAQERLSMIQGVLHQSPDEERCPYDCDSCRE